MISAKKNWLWIAVLVFTLFTAKEVSAQKDSLTKVFIIRHAEKADDGSKDPSLSVNGKNRAAAFAKTMSKTRINKIYSTPYKRTRETVDALSVQSGVPVEKYNPMDLDGIKVLVGNNKGKTLVLVGHSNTIPPILNLFSQSSQYKDIPENEFDNIWILFLKGSQLVDLVQLTY